MTLRRALLLIIVCHAIAWPRICAAQDPDQPDPSQDNGPLAGFVTRLVTEGARIDPGRTGVDRSRDFIRDLPRNLAPLALNAALGLQLVTFPLGDASPQVPYPTASLAQTTAGPSISRALMTGSPFREPALLVGRESFSLRLAYQSMAFGAIDGLDLDGRDIHVLLEDAACCPGRVDRDLLRESVALNVEQQTAVVSGSYGVSDRLDVGFAVPLTRVELRGRVESRIARVSTGAQPAVHSFDGVDRAEQTIYRSATATGLGDIRLRAKYRLLATSTSALSAALDLRMPTGSADDLLGLGAWQPTALAIASRAWPRVGVRGSVSYAWSFGDLDDEATMLPDADVVTRLDDAARAIPNELAYSAGVTMAIVPRVSASVDLIGRRLDAIHSSLAVAGVKWTIAPSVLIGLDVLFPIGDAGLTPKVTPLIGLEYAF